MRKLASIQKVWKTEPIEGADKIELAHVLGWQCVVPKGQLEAGDMVVYFEVDSFLPLGDDRWAFLEKSSYRKSEILGEGLRISTRKFRGQISQGLALPLSMFPELRGAREKDDVTKALGVRKWEVPEMVGNAGTQIGEKPFGIPTTDETRVQSDDSLRQQLLGKPYYITTKMDGTSCTMYFIDGKFGVCGRNYEYRDDSNCDMWKFAHERRLSRKLTELGCSVVLQGEFCGPGIQKNRLGLTKPEWYVFNVLLPGGPYELLPYGDMKQICDGLGVKTVPLEEEGGDFRYTLGELLEKAKGKYPNGRPKEGIVVRTADPKNGYCPELGKPLSFKVLNNDFLLKD